MLRNATLAALAAALMSTITMAGPVSAEETETYITNVRAEPLPELCSVTEDCARGPGVGGAQLAGDGKGGSTGDAVGVGGPDASGADRGY